MEFPTPILSQVISVPFLVLEFKTFNVLDFHENVSDLKCHTLTIYFCIHNQRYLVLRYRVTSPSFRFRKGNKTLCVKLAFGRMLLLLCRDDFSCHSMTPSSPTMTTRTVSVAEVVAEAASAVGIRFRLCPDKP